MADEDKSSKTEKATPKKKRDAKRKGQVAKSQDVGIAVGVLAAFGMMIIMADYFLRHMYGMMVAIISTIEDPDNLLEDPGQVFLFAMKEVGLLSIPVLVAVMVFGFVAQLAQVGIIVTGEQLKPKFSKINPMKGIKRWFAIRSLVELGKSLLKIVATLGIGFLVIKGSWPTIAATPMSSIEQIITVGGALVSGLFWKILPLFIVIAVVDALFQRWQWERDLKMSRKDLKDEYKNTEGDPYMKQARRQFHQQLSQQQATDNVPQSDVVVINPTQYAIALRYDPQRMPVPFVMARGETHLADRIRERAREGGIPVVRNKPLARQLYAQCEVGDAVPAELYRPVAEVLAYVLGVDAAAGEAGTAPPPPPAPSQNLVGSADSPHTGSNPT